jgi:hydrogenase maturation protein HypF
MTPQVLGAETQTPARLKITIRGAVQGVGFRPFVFRLAEELDLKGWVKNSVQGVFVEVEGARARLENFLLRLEAEKPPRSFIQSLESSWLDPVGYQTFEIRHSDPAGSKTTLVLPDIATCPDCLREIFDPQNRRYFYPFTNCTNCGPRFSIIESLPYDRCNTSMKKFTMCPQCQAEYDDPRDRRFHAQPNACPICGPQIELWNHAGDRVETAARAPAGSAAATMAVLQHAAENIRAGQILALKGLGGFHLAVDARNEAAVRRLRERKHREEKPLALMFPSLGPIQAACEVSRLEERLLRSPETPIVLLRRRMHRARNAPGIAPSVAPNNPNLGVMLPYTPLHHLLLSLLGFPLVATSGNLSDEPICIDEHEALDRLRDIADLFLVHNRPIVRHVDDSIVRVMAGREMLLRRARGFAPLPVQLPASAVAIPNHMGAPASAEQPKAEVGKIPGSVLSVGAHLKNTVALSVGPQVFISQHIGDLETEQAYQAFRRVIADFEDLYEASPAMVAADAHPDYLSTAYAREITRAAAPPHESSLSSQPSESSSSSFSSSSQTQAPKPPRLLSVQHHFAHVLSCMAENELTPPLLGVSWDGTGYGLDGTIWGGEFFHVLPSGAVRIAHLRTFRLPGGDKAVKEPRRAALGVLFEVFGEVAFAMNDLPTVAAFSVVELKSLQSMLQRPLNSPVTSSAGRLFDAIASLAGLRQLVRFEGQAAMELEFALDKVHSDEAYPLVLLNPGADLKCPAADLRSEISNLKSPLVLDWAPLIRAVVADVRVGTDPGKISARFHNALVQSIVEVARLFGENRVVLTGGCFQNRYLTEMAVSRLQQAGFRPYWHQRVPPNDGGIALGQIVAATCQTSLR